MFRTNIGKRKYEKLIDKNGIARTCEFEHLDDNLIIYLFSRKHRRYQVGYIDINDDGTAKIVDFRLKRNVKCPYPLDDVKYRFNFSRKGLGSQIIKISENYIKSLKIKKVNGQISYFDKDSRSFWKKMGYKITKSRNPEYLFDIHKELMTSPPSPRPAG